MKCNKPTGGEEFEDCTEEFEYHAYTLNITANGFFRCYRFNQNKDHIVSTNLTGYEGSYALVFGVNITTTSDPTVRYGVQTSFAKSGLMPDLYAETNFSPIGFDTFYTLVKEEHRDVTKTLQQELWTTTSSITRLPFTSDNCE